eukprot:TRINITY_DN10135_c0_g1_i1.p1 TRINITY_DN10135_c0_g1~~TRINITY_DN10135_c0_g1_i1.p1  ORF type:complete len:412 (-),score=65.14 TRINITY_DN10135_c0_g1_i1:32-1225(-)
MEEKKKVDKSRDKEKLSSLIIEAVDRVTEACSRLGMAEKQLETGQTAADPDYLIPESVKDFDELLTDYLARLVFVSVLLGEKVEEQVILTYKLLTATRSLLLFTSKYKKPSDTEWAQLSAEPLALVSQITSVKFKLQERGAPLQPLIVAAASAFGCLFTNDIASHLSNAKKTLEDFSGKGRGNNQALSSFVDTLYSLLVAMDSFIEDKHFKGGLVWNGNADFDPTVKLFSSIHGHQALLAMSSAPSKGVGKILQRPENWYCQFWCSERGPVTVDIKDKECEIFGCVSSEISVRGKAGSVLIQGCSNTTVTLGEVYGTVTVSQCSNIELICSAVVTIVIQETNGCKLVLNDKSLDSDITAFAASDVVIVTLEDSTTTETRIPTKITHKVKGGKATSTL